MCKVHTDFNATAAIVGSFGNGTCAMYLHGWDPGGTGNNGWDTVDCAQAIPAALQAFGAVCCGDSSKALCAPEAGIYPNCERSLGNYPKCDRQLSFEEMLAGLSQTSKLRMPDWMEAGCPCHQALWGGYAGKKPTELAQTLQCLYDEAKQGCKVCDAGHTGPGGGACTACAAGKYKPVPGSAACTSCGAGKYAEGTVSTVCTDCGSGTYSTAVGATVNSTCSGTRCSAGKYGQTGATSASATTCLLCPAGTYMALTGASACTNCTAGTYSAAVGASNCTNCALGKYSAAGASVCIDCEAGKYGTGGGGLDFTEIQAGVGISPGAPGCTSCTAGKYSAATGQTSAATCTNCTAGKYSAAGASACSDCAAGTYSAAASSTVCTICTAGKFAAASGASNCTNCGVGKYSAAGASVCIECEAGKYLAVHSVGAVPYKEISEIRVSQGQLIDTIEIRYRDGTNVFRGPVSETNQPVFVLFVGEKLVKIETWVDDQTPGWLSPGAPRLRACNFFTDSGRSQWYVSSSGIGGWAVNFLGSEQAPIIDIQRGQWSLSLITGIVQAPLEMRCSVCPPGTYSATAASVCTNCTAGKFSAAVGATVASTCAICEAGKSSDAGSTYCT
jgi:hypothetical protein